MAPSAFRDRFGYALWLAHLRLGATPKFTAVAEAVSRTQPAVSAWLAADEPPPDYRLHAPLAEFFDIDERWLIRGEGEPPHPELWKAWVAAREREGKAPLGEMKKSLRAVAKSTDQKGKGRGGSK